MTPDTITTATQYRYGVRKVDPAYKNAPWYNGETFTNDRACLKEYSTREEADCAAQYAGIHTTYVPVEVFEIG